MLEGWEKQSVMGKDQHTCLPFLCCSGAAVYLEVIFSQIPQDGMLNEAAQSCQKTTQRFIQELV